MTWHDGTNWGFGGFFLMVLLMALFWGALIGTAIWAIRQFRPRETGTTEATSSAMRILEDRFARGEIDADEFQRRREILRGGG
jgi:putative membrane protein